jgi:micrococcal nuclease|tara:strand:- start:323 stop:757 length:435 start_codon:yes stop_codon:yes gene_type:complete
VYHYAVKLIKIVDGDTVDVDIDLGFNVWLRSQRVRLHGIDTPESRTRDKEEKLFGNRAKQHLSRMIATETEHGPLVDSQKNKEIFLQSLGRGKFGRILGLLYVNDDAESVNAKMIKDHHAVAYEGQSKDEIREAHLANREKLKP